MLGTAEAALYFPFSRQRLTCLSISPLIFPLQRLVSPFPSEYDLGDSEQFLLRQRLHLQVPGVRTLVQEVQTHQR